MHLEKVLVETTATGQAIQIPESLKIEYSKVYLKKTGNVIHIIPYNNAWQNFYDSLSGFSTDFMEERNQPLHQQRESLD